MLTLPVDTPVVSNIRHAPEPNSLVSVIIATYNRREKVIRAINSVLGQTYPSIEVIVVDDGSTDGTPEALERRFGNRIRLVKSRHCGNPNAVRQQGLDRAKGQWISFLDSDDWLCSDKVSRQVDYLQQHPEWGAVYCDMKRVDEQGTLLSGSWFGDRSRMREGNLFPTVLNIVQPGQKGYELYLNWLLIRREVLQQTGGLNTRLPFLEDWEFVLRLCAHTRLGCLRQSLVVAERGTGNNYAEQYRTDYHSDPARFALPVLDHLLGLDLPVSSRLIKRAKSRVLLVSASRHFKSGHHKQGWTYWCKAVQQWPLQPALLTSLVYGLYSKGRMR